MDKETLEQKLFAHLETESLVLTPVNIGFVLGIDADEAVTLLQALQAENKVELVSGTGTGATYKRSGHATYETTPGTQSVGKSKSSAALYHLLLNVFIPGLGSLIYTRFALFIPVFLLFAGGVAMVVMFATWSKLFAILMFTTSWIVSFFGSIYYYQKDPWNDSKS